MKNFIKDRSSEIGGVVYAVFLVLLVVGLLSAGYVGITKYVYPWWLQVQRESVKESQSFTDSTNIAMSNFIREYRALDTKIAEAGDNTELVKTYKAQQGAILTQMCKTRATMREVAPDTLQFLSQHGGC